MNSLSELVIRLIGNENFIGIESLTDPNRIRREVKGEIDSLEDDLDYLDPSVLKRMRRILANQGEGQLGFEREARNISEFVLAPAYNAMAEGLVEKIIPQIKEYVKAKYVLQTIPMEDEEQSMARLRKLDRGLKRTAGAIDIAAKSPFGKLIAGIPYLGSAYGLFLDLFQGASKEYRGSETSKDLSDQNLKIDAMLFSGTYEKHEAHAKNYLKRELDSHLRRKLDPGFNRTYTQLRREGHEVHQALEVASQHVVRAITGYYADSQTFVPKADFRKIVDDYIKSANIVVDRKIPNS